MRMSNVGELFIESRDAKVKLEECGCMEIGQKVHTASIFLNVEFLLAVPDHVVTRSSFRIPTGRDFDNKFFSFFN